MTTISSVDSSSLTGVTTQSDVLDKTAFFEMLIAQLKNQDPLNPLDGTDFTAQLAQFSSLEQLTNMNETQESMLTSLLSANNAQAVGLIGKEVTAMGNSLQVDGESAEIRYTLAEQIATGEISIYDQEGNLVDTVELIAQEKGEHTLTWDCGAFQEGIYSFEVYAENAVGEAVEVDTMIKGIVQEVSFGNGYAYLMVNGQNIALGDVAAVR